MDLSVSFMDVYYYVLYNNFPMFKCVMGKTSMIIVFSGVHQSTWPTFGYHLPPLIGLLPYSSSHLDWICYCQFWFVWKARYWRPLDSHSSSRSCNSQLWPKGETPYWVLQPFCCLLPLTTLSSLSSILWNHRPLCSQTLFIPQSHHLPCIWIWLFLYAPCPCSAKRSFIHSSIQQIFECLPHLRYCLGTREAAMHKMDRDPCLWRAYILECYGGVRGITQTNKYRILVRYR